MAPTYYTRGTTGLYRVEQPKTGGFHNSERWNGAQWVSDRGWIEDLMEGHLDVHGENPADIAARFPGAIRSA
jgi:hypothetical protein